MKALLVDDDEINRKLLADLLQLKNVECIEAQTGKDAVALVTPEFGFCILDLHLSDMDGFEVSRQIRKKCPGLPVIAYTATALKEEMRRLVETKLFDAMLSKPLDLENFEAIIARFLP